MSGHISPLGEALFNIVDVYQEAMKDERVRKPISYALYKTWKEWDLNEPQRQTSGTGPATAGSTWTKGNRQSIITAFERCFCSDTAACPGCYQDGPGFGYACRKWLCQDVLALLKEDYYADGQKALSARLETDSDGEEGGVQVEV